MVLSSRPRTDAARKKSSSFLAEGTQSLGVRTARWGRGFWPIPSSKSSSFGQTQAWRDLTEYKQNSPPRAEARRGGLWDSRLVLRGKDQNLRSTYFFSIVSGSLAQESLQSQSGWVPLLLALLHEYTASNSPWQPYLSLWQDFRSLDHPMFW